MIFSTHKRRGAARLLRRLHHVSAGLVSKGKVMTKLNDINLFTNNKQHFAPEKKIGPGRPYRLRNMPISFSNC